MSETTPPVFNDAFRVQLGDLFRWRRDVRRFLSKPVAPELFDALLDVASLAPSVGLSEPWRFVTVDNPERRAAVRANFERCNAEALAHQAPALSARYAQLKLAGLNEAPSQFALFCDPNPAKGHGLGRRTMPETTTYSAVMALHSLWLAARTEGLGLGWVSILDVSEIKLVLNVPVDWTFIGYFCLGYPEEESHTPELERHGWQFRGSSELTRLRR